jgi:ssDNA-binding Zn-finger/Zn-ribbon topoisomerase 1
VKHAKRTTYGLILPASEPFTQDHANNILPELPLDYPTGESTDQHAFIFDKRIYKSCEKCGHKYHSKSGLWKHRKMCEGIPESSATDASTPPVAPATATATATEQDMKGLMMDMLKNNQEFQHKIIEMMCNQQSLAISAAVAAVAAAVPPANNSNSNSNNYTETTNSHNNTFNLQFFLNEQCKDAMNITDFARSINLKVSDLDEFGRMGYVQGMSKLFIDSLKNTDVCKRPIHCSDAKRETLYVKDADKWERDDAVNTKITNAVRVVEHKNIGLVNEWAKQNPRCENSSTKENTQYFDMSRAVLDGDDKNIAKVIKLVAKEVVIDRS